MATINSMSDKLNSSLIIPTETLESTSSFSFPLTSALSGMDSSSFAETSSAFENHSFLGIQEANAHKDVNRNDHSSCFTLLEVKREPCQVSEVTTSNNIHSNHIHSKSVTSSTMTTMIKIESTLPAKYDVNKSVQHIISNNSVHVGEAVTRKKIHDTSIHAPKDLSHLGIRVADMGGIPAARCSNIYFANADVVPGSNNEAANSLYNANRSCWQYPNSFPLESVISMSPIGLQYARDANKGQFILLPSTNETFPQAPFLWQPYMQQTPISALQTIPHYMYPPFINSQTSSASQSYAEPLQFFGSNYFTAAAASSTICQNSLSDNGSRFISMESDIRRTDKIQKCSGTKVDDWHQSNITNRGNLTFNLEAFGKADILKDNSEPIYLQSNENLVESVPLIPTEKSHILFNNTNSSSHLFTLPIISTPSEIIPYPQRHVDEVLTIYKNSATRGSCSGSSKIPKTQNVNIQTDAPVCSEDECSLSVLPSAESVSLQHCETKKSMPSLCHKNLDVCKDTLPKESYINSLNNGSVIYDLSKLNNSFSLPETCFHENKSAKNSLRNEGEPLHSSTAPSSDECTAESLILKNTHHPSLLEMSGLELLSNISTELFVNHDSIKAVRVKQEPPESVETESTNKSFDVGYNNLEIQYSGFTEKYVEPDASKPSSEQFVGGLNLLCALAEQRIQEEVEGNNLKKSVNRPSNIPRKKKQKHSKSTSHRYFKRNIKKYKKEHELSKYNDKHGSLKNVFKNFDLNYKKIKKWPDPEDFFKAMESDMRMRLADITRQYKKKKHKIEEINKKKKLKRQSCKNPSFIYYLDKYQSETSNLSPADESECQHLNILNKNTTNCATKSNENEEEMCISLDKGISLEANTQNPNNSSELSEKILYKQKEFTSMLRIDRNLENAAIRPKCQQSQQKNKVVIKDKKLVLSNEYLYRKETRVLTDMGGLFYAGILKPLQPPDVYAITLDGERGNKSHILSREEILRDTILEVIPKSIENVPVGTRLCAYWSQQYRCLYPGKAIDPYNTDNSPDFVTVEFDDGDSGRIQLQNIRFLLSDYPIVDYKENSLANSVQTPKGGSIKLTPTYTTSKKSTKRTICESSAKKSIYISYNPRTGKNKKQIQTKSTTLSTPNESALKNSDHRKKKKHKKVHTSAPTTPITVINNEDDKIRPDRDLQIYNNKKLKSNKEKNVKYSEKLDKTNKFTSKLLTDNQKPDINTKEHEESTLNAVSVISEKFSKKERVDYNFGKGSKIAAFLPERRMWGWLGKAYRKAGLKGRPRKQFYKSITRGKETINVGDCAVFLSTGRPDRPYIGRIESMWETTSSNKIVRVRWFYHPEETTGCPTLKYPGALFDSPHEDENDVQTISHRCKVVEFSKFIAKFGTDSAQYQSIYDNNQTYYLSGYYNPRLQVLKLQPNIPTIGETSL